ncbi:hypothetical protein DFJ73DRAFT_872205, partial [Zopfochytrium polystomum]
MIVTRSHFFPTLIRRALPQRNRSPRFVAHPIQSLAFSLSHHIRIRSHPTSSTFTIIEMSEPTTARSKKPQIDDVEDTRTPPPKEPPAIVQPPWVRVHAEAVEREEATYKDPATGYTVFTSKLHLDRGYCCGNACRHCPYDKANVGKPKSEISAQARRVRRARRAARGGCRRGERERERLGCRGNWQRPM